MFPENLVQACFQQIQTVYLPIKPKNATAKALQMTTPAGYVDDYYDHHEADFYQDLEESTTAASVNLTEEAFKRSLKYADGINVLG